MAPLVNDASFGLSPRGVTISARYGQLPEADANNATTAWAASVAFGSRFGTLTATAGQYDADCPDPECRPRWMLGLGANGALASRALGTTTATLGLSGEIGWGQEEFSTSYLSAHVGLPVHVAIPLTPGGLRVVPFVAPGFGWGRASEDQARFGEDGREAFTGTRFTLAGGLALRSATGRASAQLGLVKVPVSGGGLSTSVGVSFTP